MLQVVADVEHIIIHYHGSIKGSKHISGKAVDFWVETVNVNDLLNYTTYLMKSGVLNYTYTNNTNMSGAVHIDII